MTPIISIICICSKRNGFDAFYSIHQREKGTIIHMNCYSFFSSVSLLTTYFVPDVHATQGALFIAGI